MKMHTCFNGILFCFFSFMFSFLEIFFSSQALAYTPPIGIPSPTFGIEQQHTAYAGQTYAAGGFIYRDSGNGPFSHYIDNTSMNCTDINNSFGTIDSPRCSIPTSIPIGSIIELHGGPYNNINISGVKGTSSNPIFIRGYSSSNKIHINGRDANKRSVSVNNSSYVIIENIITDGSTLTGQIPSSGIAVRSPADHIAVRHSECTGYPIPDLCVDSACWNAALWSVGAGSDGAAGGRVSNIVFYDNFIHNNADKTWPPLYETGRHGIMILGGAEYVWIIGNKMTRSGDDGVQVYWATSGANGPPAHHLYIGDNKIYEMGENAFDIKQSYDVVISKNKVWGFRKTNQLGAGSDGSAIVLNNDDPSDRLWVLYNEIFNSNIGIRANTAGAANLIGNVIYNIVRTEGAPAPTATNVSGCGITASRSADLNILYNTLGKIDSGVCIASTAGPIHADNNLITNLNEATVGYAIAYYTGTLPVYNNMIYSANGNNRLLKISCNNCVVGSDPLLFDVKNNDFRVSAGSPAISAGGGISTSFNTFNSLYNMDISYDFDGRNRPTAGPWTLGAFEYSTNIPAPIIDLIAPK